MKGGSPIIFLLVLVFGLGSSYLLLGQRIELPEQLRARPRPIRSILPTDPVAPAYNKKAATLLYGTEVRTLSSHGTFNATCAAFQSKVPNQSARNMGVAGLFNTGTNLLETLLIKNCELDPAFTKRMKRAHAKVPWGKHNPVAVRGTHTSPQAQGIAHDLVLPIVYHFTCVLFQVVLSRSTASISTSISTRWGGKLADEISATVNE